MQCRSWWAPFLWSLTRSRGIEEKKISQLILKMIEGEKKKKNVCWDVKISRKGRPRIWKYTILNTMEKAVSACEDQDEERKITPFTPLRDRKLHAMHNAAFLLHNRTHPRVRPWNQQSHDENATLCTGLGRTTAGLPDSPTHSPSQALLGSSKLGMGAFWTLFSVQMFLVVWPREKGREGITQLSL